MSKRPGLLRSLIRAVDEWSRQEPDPDPQPKGEPMIVSGKIAEVTLTFAVPPGMDDAQAQQVFQAAISVGGGVLAVMRRMDCQVKPDPDNKAVIQ